MTVNLSNIKNSGSQLPPRVDIYGPPGAGKTTCASRAFKPVAISTEEGFGTNEVPCFETPESFDQVNAYIKELVEEDHDYRTLIIDSIDGIEKLIERAVCLKGGKEFMSDFAYYKGNVESAARIEKFLHDLDDLRRTKKMQIILISHSVRVEVGDPSLGTYDRLEPNLHKKAVPLIVAWADIVAFMAPERVITSKASQGSSDRAITTTRMSGSRYLHFEDNGSFIAKNRRGLPSEMEISEERGWGEVEDAMRPPEKKAKKKA